MTWEILKVYNNPTQMSVTLVNIDKSATCTTDYHQADALARKTLGAATLNTKGIGLSGRATRTYVSQCY